MPKLKISNCLYYSFILGVLLFSLHASALNFDTYIEQVRSQNEGYKGASEQAKASSLQRQEARLIFTPKLFSELTSGHDGKTTDPSLYKKIESDKYSLGISQEFSFGLQTKLYYELEQANLVHNNGTADTEYWDASPKLEVSLPLWGNGFGRSSRANQELINQQNTAQQYSSDWQRQNLEVSAESTYWQLSAWQEVVHINEQALRAAEDILKYVDRKNKMNLGENTDVIQARALVEARTLELQVAKNEEQEILRNFNGFLQRDLFQPVEALEKINYVALEQAPAVSTRPGKRADVLSEEAQLKVAKANAVIAKERNRPTLDVYANYSLNGRDSESDEAMRDASNTRRDTAFVGMRFVMPLNISALSDAANGAQRAQRAAEYNQSYLNYTQEQDWQNLSRKIVDASGNIKLLAKIEEAQKKKLELERVRLRQGRTTTYQVLLFEQDYSQAALSKVKSAANLLVLKSQLKLYQANN